MESQPASLITLPTEVLAEILKEVLYVTVVLPGFNRFKESTQEKETLQNLKSLRLAHRRFAQCDIINKILFSNICLEPTRGSLTSIQRGDFSRVASYVRSVTFATPPSWTLPREAYDKIIIRSQEISIPISPGEFLDWLASTPDHCGSIRPREGHDKTLRTSREPCIPPEALKVAYDAYMNEARDTQALLQNPESELKQTWTQLLRSLGDRLETVRLLSYDSITGDKLFAMVVSCLAASGVAISHLSVQMFMTGKLECKSIPGWNQIDFSKLKTLHISLEIPCGVYGMAELSSWVVPDTHAENMTIRAGDFCHDLLDKCHSSIQHFGCGIDQFGQGLICWPTRRSTYDFPELTHLTQKGDIFPSELARWILHLKNLRHLELGGRVCEGQYSADMLFVFDAIRDHPNVKGEDPKGLKFDWYGLGLEDSSSYSGVICRDASIATPRFAPNPSLGFLEDINYALEAYLYGEVPIQQNETLQCAINHWSGRRERLGPIVQESSRLSSIK
ncbi:hypothetical protein FHETE_8571 [Fusarium heterosporum]|uniref:Uncharacterized protein n=1 Tax=Fusarium heterosporum TaxID=42747 RepID=A0A8H5T252_FUSHE|nr:hypothetical protein FHETE_8571 [Fusarium heterosporum]